MSERDKRDEETRAGYHEPDGSAHDPGADEKPVDLGQVQADDAFLDALARDTLPHSGSGLSAADARVSQVLTAWKREVDAEPLPELIGTDEALAVVARARRPRRRRPVLMPVAAAVAVLALLLSGIGWGARSAEPGDRLFGLTKVLFSDRAQSEQAAETIRTELDEASSALGHGEPDEAKDALQRAERQLAEVNAGAEDREELAARIRAMLETLRARVDEMRNAPPTASAADEESQSGEKQQASTAPSPKESAATAEPSQTVTSEPDSPPSSAPPSSTSPDDEATDDGETADSTGKSGDPEQTGQDGEQDGTASSTPTGRSALTGGSDASSGGGQSTAPPQPSWTSYLPSFLPVEPSSFLPAPTSSAP